MVDTIVLTIPNGQYTVLEPYRFELLDSGAYVQNSSNEDKMNGIYKPNLTIKPPKFGSILKIQFSIPKLIFGNNLDEVDEADFEIIIDTLIKRLAEMGIRIFRYYLINASVSIVHFSKNFPLSDYVSASIMIKELSKINLNGKLDLNNTHFRNDGHAVYYYASNNHIVFYDKLADINKPAKRAVDNDKTVQQMSLFDTFKKAKMINEILRVEIRITHRTKLKSILGNKNPTFQTVFSKLVAQKVLLDYWKRFIEANLFVFRLSGNDPKNLLQNIIKDPKIKVKDALAVLASKYFIDQHGLKTLKDMVKHRFTAESWYRFNKELDEIASRPIASNFIIDELNKIKQELIDFRPFKFNDLKQNDNK